MIKIKVETNKKRFQTKVKASSTIYLQISDCYPFTFVNTKLGFKE